MPIAARKSLMFLARTIFMVCRDSTASYILAIGARDVFLVVQLVQDRAVVRFSSVTSTLSKSPPRLILIVSFHSTALR